MTEIVRSEAVLGGDPRLEGRRISVLQISEMVLDGDQSPEYVADQLDISLGDVHSALAYITTILRKWSRCGLATRRWRSLLPSALSDPVTSNGD